MRQPEVRVHIDHGDGRAPGELPIRINGPDANFRIATDRIAASAVRQVDDVLLDLLDIAASVFCADGSVPRGGATRLQFGAGWRRRLGFTIPVRVPDLWQRGDVAEALTDAVGFLMDDDVSFAFESGRRDVAGEVYLDFASEGSDRSRIDEVVLFSGGLDSLAGALDTLNKSKGRIALVTHLSAPKIEAHQRRLAKSLGERFEGRVLHIPVRANRKGAEARETTQRSRSFLFAALGFAIARTLGASRISFFENGIVSHNLPFSPQVIGSMATRTTHPLVLHKFAQLLGLLGGAPIAIENRFAWETKTDIVGKIAVHGAADLIDDTVSCTSVRDQSILHTHCGSCSQCLDRRFAILAAGLDASDHEDKYETEVLSGARGAEASRTLALDWTRHALRLQGMAFADFIIRFAGEVTRLIEGYPDRDQLETARTIHALQQRHGGYVRAVLAAAALTASQAPVDRPPPATSLLRMVLAPSDAGFELPRLPPDRPPERRGGTEPRVEDLRDIFPLQVAFEIRNGTASVHVKGLGEVRGSPAAIAHFLHGFYDEDKAAGLSREKFRFVLAGTIAIGLTGSKGAVWQMSNAAANGSPSSTGWSRTRNRRDLC